MTFTLDAGGPRQTSSRVLGAPAFRHLAGCSEPPPRAQGWETLAMSPSGHKRAPFVLKARPSGWSRDSHLHPPTPTPRHPPHPRRLAVLLGADGGRGQSLGCRWPPAETDCPPATCFLPRRVRWPQPPPKPLSSQTFYKGAPSSNFLFSFWQKQPTFKGGNENIKMCKGHLATSPYSKTSLVTTAGGCSAWDPQEGNKSRGASRGEWGCLCVEGYLSSVHRVGDAAWVPSHRCPEGEVCGWGEDRRKLVPSKQAVPARVSHAHAHGCWCKRENLRPRGAHSLWVAQPVKRRSPRSEVRMSRSRSCRLY